MKGLLHVCALALVFAMSASPLAFAGDTWVAPVGGAAVITAYAATYGGGRTHRGVDLAASPGESVAAPSGGTVVFAGTVPADGGGTCGAVTIELPDGLRVSLLPLSEVFVSQGAVVVSGDAVGSVAATGDDSATDPHLHLGLRRGNAYVDPTGFLPAAAALPTQPSVETPPSGSGGNVGMPPTEAPSSVGQPAAATPVGAAAASTASAPMTAPAASVGPAAAPGLATAAAPGGSTARPRHPLPQDAEIPAVSQLASVGTTRSAWAWLARAIAQATGVRTPPIGVAVAGIAFVLVGVLGLRRQFACDRVS